MHDEAWEAARREMQMTMKARKGESTATSGGWRRLAEESFNSNAIVDASVFCTSTRSVINAASLSGILARRARARSGACSSARAARQATEAVTEERVFNVVCRTANQADSSAGRVAMVTDDFGAGGRHAALGGHRMATWKGETVAE